jgi:hypothetical protein
MAWSIQKWRTDSVAKQWSLKNRGQIVETGQILGITLRPPCRSRRNKLSIRLIPQLIVHESNHLNV